MIRKVLYITHPPVMQRVGGISIVSISQNTVYAKEKLLNADEDLAREVGGNLAPRDRVTDKSCVKVSYNTTSGATPMRTTPSTRTVWIFPVLFLRNQLFCHF